jgi:hypothetical protein
VSTKVGQHQHAVDCLLRLEARRAKLLGLDAPEKVCHGGGEEDPVIVRVIREGTYGDEGS